MKVLLCFAHPDDETFSSSGTLIKLSEKGAKTSLIMATRGEKGMLGDPPITRREDLGKVRERELRKSAKITGISKIYFLDFIDGTLHNVPQKLLQRKILHFMKKENPDVVITFEKHGISRHPDHIAISKATTDAFFTFMQKTRHRVRLYHVGLSKSSIEKFHKEGFRYDAFGGLHAVPDKEISTWVDISKTYKQKVLAMKCHISQKKDWARILKMSKLQKGKFECFQLIAENTIL